ncbi:hypothetical protein M0804_009202 [Polistes exclamans]|nr:hypothetical protein M0804_009202 [Polistes exclamans]
MLATVSRCVGVVLSIGIRKSNKWKIKREGANWSLPKAVKYIYGCRIVGMAYGSDIEKGSPVASRTMGWGYEDYGSKAIQEESVQGRTDQPSIGRVVASTSGYIPFETCPYTPKGVCLYFSFLVNSKVDDDDEDDCRRNETRREDGCRLHAHNNHYEPQMLVFSGLNLGRIVHRYYDNCEW